MWVLFLAIPLCSLVFVCLLAHSVAAVEARRGDYRRLHHFATHSWQTKSNDWWLKMHSLGLFSFVLPSWRYYKCRILINSDLQGPCRPPSNLRALSSLEAFAVSLFRTARVQGIAQPVLELGFCYSTWEGLGGMSTILRSQMGRRRSCLSHTIAKKYLRGTSSPWGCLAY